MADLHVYARLKAGRPAASSPIIEERRMMQRWVATQLRVGRRKSQEKENKMVITPTYNLSGNYLRFTSRYLITQCSWVLRHASPQW